MQSAIENEASEVVGNKEIVSEFTHEKSPHNIVETKTEVYEEFYNGSLKVITQGIGPDVLFGIVDVNDNTILDCIYTGYSIISPNRIVVSQNNSVDFGFENSISWIYDATGNVISDGEWRIIEFNNKGEGTYSTYGFGGIYLPDGESGEGAFLIDHDGNKVLPTRFDYFSMLSKWDEYLVVGKDGKEYVIDLNGNTLDESVDNFLASRDDGNRGENPKSEVETATPLFTDLNTKEIIPLSIEIIDNDTLDNYHSYYELSEPYSEEYNIDQKLIFKPNKAITDFKFIEIRINESWVSDADDSIYFAGDILYSIDVFNPEKPFVVNWIEFGAIPHRGISYTDENGKFKSFYLTHSGDDGKLILISIC
ncbi:MAG: hypothetical protein FWG70_05835 [Oscillospiraceae bacterium]|nr:hypothetical protein [Oscillospiraceae bacterium]